MILVTLLALLGLALLVPFVLCYLQVHPSKFPNTETPDAFDLPYEEVHFPAARDGLKLSGWFIPSAGSDTTVLVCHGLGANKSNFLSVVPFLHYAGYNTLIFDFRGHGDSSGRTASFGVKEARDVEGAANFLAGRPDSKRVIGYGFSMGAAALLHAAPHLPYVKTLVLDSAFADFPHLVRGHLAPVPVRLRPALVGLVSFFWFLQTGARMSEMSNVKHAGQLADRRLLIIHGMRDNLIPPVHAQILSGVCTGEHRLLMLPGSHCEAHYFARAVYEARVLAWIKG